MSQDTFMAPALESENSYFPFGIRVAWALGHTNFQHANPLWTAWKVVH